MLFGIHFGRLEMPRGCRDFRAAYEQFAVEAVPPDPGQLAVVVEDDLGLITAVPAGSIVTFWRDVPFYLFRAKNERGEEEVIAAWDNKSRHENGGVEYLRISRDRWSRLHHRNGHVRWFATPGAAMQVLAHESLTLEEREDVNGWRCALVRRYHAYKISLAELMYGDVFIEMLQIPQGVDADVSVRKAVAHYLSRHAPVQGEYRLERVVVTPDGEVFVSLSLRDGGDPEKRRKILSYIFTRPEARQYFHP